MPTQKRGSQIIKKAEQRLTGYRSIDSYLSLGDKLNLTAYELKIEAARQKIAIYNTNLSTLTQQRSEAIAAERELAEMSERMFAGLISKYGRNSIEYEMVGGKPRGRKRRTTPAIAPANSSLPTTTIISTNGTKAKAVQNGKEKPVD
jgi:hypothetical protein